jgi:hypothetical protein
MKNLGYNIRRLVRLERDGHCARLSALHGCGLRVGSCKRTARSPASVKTLPDPGVTLALALQQHAQLRQESPKAGIVRGARQ